MAYVKLCKTSDLRNGDMKQFNIKGIEILAIRQSDRFYCLEARCTHAGAPLAEGDLTEELLTCPWHGSTFNIKNGAVINGPAREPLKIYSYIVKEELLLIEI